MKHKAFALAAALLFTTGVHASNPFFSSRRVKATPTWSLSAGLDASNFFFSGDYAHGGFRPGFNVGLTADIGIMESLSIRTGLFYTMKGMKYKEDMQSTLLNYTETENVRACYVELPILAAYHYAISPKSGLTLTAGPYVAVGTNGTWKHRRNGKAYTDPATGENLGHADAFGNGRLGRFDAGMQFGASVHIAHYDIGIAYDCGIADISRHHRDYMGHEVRMRTGSFSLNVGYTF